MKNKLNENNFIVKQIPNYPNYYVTSSGEVYRKKGDEFKQLKTARNSAGYVFCSLNGGFHFVAELMWKTFVGDIPQGYTLEHIDRNNQNNDISNLSVVPREINALNKHISCIPSYYTNKDGSVVLLWSLLGEHTRIKYNNYPTMKEAFYELRRMKINLYKSIIKDYYKASGNKYINYNKLNLD